MSRRPRSKKNKEGTTIALGIPHKRQKRKEASLMAEKEKTRQKSRIDSDPESDDSNEKTHENKLADLDFDSLLEKAESNAILDFGSDDEDNEADYGEGISSAFSEQKPKKKRSKRSRSDRSSEGDLREKEKKTKKIRENEVEGGAFAAAMASILQTGEVSSEDDDDSERMRKKSKTTIAADPILSRTRKPFEELEKDRLERMVRAELRRQKAERLNRGHLTAEKYSSYPLEKRLKSVATNGVVMMFNEIRKHQKLDQEEGADGGKGKQEGEALSRDKFMKLLKGEGHAEDMLSEEESEEEEAAKEWLRDDYAMKGGTKIRSWNRGEFEREQREREGEREVEEDDEIEDVALEDEDEF